MARKVLVDHRAQGDAVLGRFERFGVKPDVAEAHASFAQAHAAFMKEDRKAVQAQGKRDEALTRVGELDAQMDALLPALSDEMMLAGLVGRHEGFGGYSAHSPSKLAGLGYKKQLEEAKRLADAVRPKAAAGSALSSRLGALDLLCLQEEDAFKALTQEQASYDAARGQRDAALPTWTQALARLQRRSTDAYDAPSFQALFAPPSDLQRPRPTRKKAPKPA
jgi:hypothetical protein